MTRTRLAIVKHPDGWWNDKLQRPLPIVSAEPLWRARRGYLIHRPRSGMIYLHNRHMSLSWYCGNQTNEPILVRPECMDGLKMCRICEALCP